MVSNVTVRNLTSRMQSTGRAGLASDVGIKTGSEMFAGTIDITI